MLKIGEITDILIDLKMKIPEIYLKEELNRFITESRSERIVETPLVLGSIPREKSTILDIGCRYSLLPLQLASLGHRVYGIDIHKYRRRHKNFHFINGDILDCKLKKNFFDFAISLSTIEHIGLTFYGEKNNKTGDIDAVNRVHDLLKEKGSFVLTLPFGIPKDNKWYRIYDLKRLKSLLGMYKIIEIKTFIENNRNWFPASVKDAEKVESLGSVGSVVFVQAQKA